MRFALLELKVNFNLISHYDLIHAGGAGHDREAPGVGARHQDGEAVGVGQGACFFLD